MTQILYMCVLCEVKREILDIILNSVYIYIKIRRVSRRWNFENIQPFAGKQRKTCVEVGGFKLSSGMLARCRLASETFCDPANSTHGLLVSLC
jgi:hypothetical protein